MSGVLNEVLNIINTHFQTETYRTLLNPPYRELLREGDHVAWHRSYGIWHHAIVSGIEENQIKVIHYSGQDKRSKPSIIEESLNVDSIKDDFFRIDYSEEINRVNAPDSVLERAKTSVGETRYNIFTNNCEHFATYCKTGRYYSIQVRWFIKKFVESFKIQVITYIENYFISSTSAWLVKFGERIVDSIAMEVKTRGNKGILASAATAGMKEVSMAMEMGQKCYQGATKSLSAITVKQYYEIAKVFAPHVVRLADRKGKKVSNWTDTVTEVAIETISCVYDLLEMHKVKEAGNRGNKDFKKRSTERVSEGVSSVVGIIIGGKIGGSIPRLGATFGAALGNFAGKLIGSNVGHWLGKFCWN